MIIAIELWCRCLDVIDLIVVIPGKNKSSGLFESAAGIEERNDKKLLYIDNTFIDIDNSILIQLGIDIVSSILIS